MLLVTVVREYSSKVYQVVKICDVEKDAETQGLFPANFDAIEKYEISEEAAAAKGIKLGSMIEDVKAAVEYDIINPNTTKVETLP